MYLRREPSHYILTRGLFLCALLLAGAIALLLKAERGGPLAFRFYEYASAFQFTAQVAFGCALIGSLLMEDMLRYYEP